MLMLFFFLFFLSFYPFLFEFQTVLALALVAAAAAVVVLFRFVQPFGSQLLTNKIALCEALKLQFHFFSYGRHIFTFY